MSREVAVVCPICNISEDEIIYLHKRFEHEPDENWQACKACEEQFEDPQSFYLHRFRKHHGDELKPVKFSKPVETDFWNQLDAIVSKMERENPGSLMELKCGFCQKSCKSYAKLLHHLWDKHKNK